MVLRSIGTLAIIALLQASFPANRAKTLRNSYGPSISENSPLVRPGVTRYGQAYGREWGCLRGSS